MLAADGGAAQGRAQRAADHDRRPGLRRLRHLWRRHPDARLDRIAKAGLRYTQFHSTALCSPTRAALITGRNHHSVGFRRDLGAWPPATPATTRSSTKDNATVGDDPERQRLRHVLVRQEPQHAHLSIQPGRTVRPVAQRDGLRVLLRVHGRRDRPVDALSLPQSLPRSSPGSASPATTSSPTWRTRPSST